MSINKAVAVLTKVFDEISGLPVLPDANNCERLFRSLVDSLSDYPKTDANNELKEVAAYLYASTARNTLKLAYMGFVPYQTAYCDVCNCLQNAFSLLTDGDRTFKWQ